MGEVIVITSGKGGVGKTTTTANLGTGLSQLGYKVAVIDADIGLRNLDVVMGLENRIVYDLVDVVEGTCRLRQALIKDKRYEGLHLLPAAQTKDKNAISPEQMQKLTNNLIEMEGFDYVLVDCPAGIEQGFRNAIAGASRAIVVTTPEISAVRDADRIIGLLEASELRDPLLIINRIRIDMVKKGDMMNIEDMIDILAIDLLGVIPDDEAIVIATNKGEPAVTDNTSMAGQAYRNIAKRITGEQVPYMSMEATEGFVAKIRKIFGLAK
ncbi:septum site-determining protein MinD [Natronincola ferrireducens]|uniref:Septum site-determining protein MinD n=1 Tax=Natronincola ferrireducens TaxID=393762 RepID=A0A1G9D2K9_9FIRM|nr:septum site-determining protein MinD [Natronincola ferrireducens]SDK58053.1 septum site-determining protein MinD [Natronincola ferrireducens]